MELVSRDITTLVYIESETEFNRAKMMGFWEAMFSRMIGRQRCLIAIDEAVERNTLEQSLDLGLQDVPLDRIVGSVGRSQDFTRQFRPCSQNKGGRERWRKIYSLAVTGSGFPPVDLYKIGQEYFVRDGHHRVSVAGYLGWKTIQAYVIEIQLDSGSLLADDRLGLHDEVSLC